MAQFYAEIQGNRGRATRMGTKNSGITAHIRGWHIGARVNVSHENGRDVVRIWKTGGSSGFKPAKLIAEFTEDD
jgi:hypothetical protein